MRGNSLKHVLSSSYRVALSILLCMYASESRCQPVEKEDTMYVKALLTDGRDSMWTNPGQALQMAIKGISISRKINYQFGAAAGLLLEGAMHARLGKPADAIGAFKEALEIAQQNNIPLLETKAYENLGNAFDDIGDYEQAKTYYEKCFELNKTNPDSANLANMYLSFGLLLNHMKDLGNGIKYLQKAADLCTTLHQYDGVQIAYSDIAENYLIMGQYTEAFTWLFRSLRLSDSLRQKDNLPYTYSTLGTCYDKIGRKDSALFYYHKGLDMSRSLDDKHLEVTNLSYMGEVYINMDKQDSAEKYCKAAFLIARDISDKTALFNIENDLSSVYQKKQNYKSAYEYLSMAFKTRDSLFSENKEKGMAELVVRYDNRELEDKNKLLLKESTLQNLHLRQKNIFIYGAIGAFIALLVIALLLLRQSKLKANQQRMELEQKQLLAQINPHFIFNCLNSIQQFVVQNDTINANKYLADFALLMRQTLDNSKDGVISLKREIEYLENYLSFESMRFEDKFTYSLTCNDDVNINMVEVPSMIIQPFVENAIRHGLFNLKDREGRLSIHFSVKDGCLICEVDDNGIGMEESRKIKAQRLIKYQSHGMELTRQRLALVSKMNSGDYTISVINKKDANQQPVGTTIIIKFPMHT